LRRPHDHGGAGVVSIVQRRQLYGPEQAELSAEDWLHELIEIDGLPASAREWRLITAKVRVFVTATTGFIGFRSRPRTDRRCAFSELS